MIKARDDPFRLARLFRDGNYRHHDAPTLVYHRDDFMAWDGHTYRTYRDAQTDLAAAIEDEFNRINAALVSKVTDEQRRARKEVDTRDIPPAQKVTTSIVNNAMLALRSESALSWDAEPPCWLDAAEDHRPDPLDILPETNGLLDLASMRLTPPTPQFFSSFSLDYAYDPNALCPEVWLKFLADVWLGDPSSIRELQKWFGYLLTPDTRQQKILLIVGPRRSGKSTIARVLERMIGLHNVDSPTLAGLATPFGLWTLVGKTLAIFKDARVTGTSSDKATVVERLLNISGEDSVTIDRKYQRPIMQKLFTRIAIISNETPNFRDSSGALRGGCARSRPSTVSSVAKTPTLPRSSWPNCRRS